MNSKVIFSVCLVITTIAVCSGRAATNEPIGKYQVSKTNYNDGKYRPVRRNEGGYLHTVQPYVHVHDNRELGQYKHIAIPYDGGYGPYSGLLNPYRHDGDGSYDKYTTTSTTTRRPTTTTTTTVRPRLFNYHEEGGWKILRQEEEKKKHKYDYLYLTENGIYGEEKAHLRKGAGTAASGYYEYTGDDGELYRVNYKSDERGFIPEADHIPTPPPIPDAIKRALEYVAKKKEIHGVVQSGAYEHKADPVRQNNLINDRPLNDIRPVPYQPKPKIPLPTLAPLPRFQEYSPVNQYDPLPTGLGSVSSQPEQQQSPQQEYQSQTVAPYVDEQKLAVEPAQQLAEPKQEEVQSTEQPQQDQLEDKPAESDVAVTANQEPLPQASEQHNEFQPPYQVPENLTNKDNYEDTTA